MEKPFIFIVVIIVFILLGYSGSIELITKFLISIFNGYLKVISWILSLF